MHLPQRILKAEKTKARMLRLLTPALELLSFVAELIDEEQDPPPLDLLSARIFEPAANVSTVWDGLNLISITFDEMDERRRRFA